MYFKTLHTLKGSCFCHESKVGTSKDLKFTANNNLDVPRLISKWVKLQTLFINCFFFLPEQNTVYTIRSKKTFRDVRKRCFRFSAVNLTNLTWKALSSLQLSSKFLPKFQ